MVALRKYLFAKKIISNYLLLLEDAKYLLSVEEFHCRNNEEVHGESMKNRIRNYVKSETSNTWSGKFTASSINKEIAKMNVIQKKVIEPAEKFKNKILLSSL